MAVRGEGRGDPAGEALVVLSTAPEREADGLARLLVEEGLAGCVSMAMGVRSVYRWRGEVTTEDEVMMVIKTTRRRLAELRDRYLAAHSYDVPEFVVLRPEEVEPRYLAWLVGE